ncbi:MAG: Rieske 2Fe-2S domain-containing protein [Alphaproteobacteria bacterium]|nr:MAG: Rieske 2Fe-2S domain-containing protein [Alphaproteobacteria bacterium]
MAWQRIASLSEIAVDAVLGVDVDGSRVALYRLANEVFATAGICTHAMALLSDGFVEDGNIECPLHQSQFDIRSGKALCAPATEDLRTYAVKLDGDEILIDMEQQAEFTQAIPKPMPDRQAARPVTDTQTISATNSDPELALMKRYVWPTEGLTRIPDWVYTDQTIYEREVEKIFHGRTWNYVALECEVPNPGDFIRSNVGPTPVVVVRAADCSINVFENRCSHRAAEFCRELSGNTKEFVCPYHQWSYDLHGNLAGIPFRRGVNGKGGMPADFNAAQHGLRRLNVTSHRGVVFASYVQDMEPLQDYLGPEVLKEFEATFDGRKPRLLGYYRHTLPGNWKLYHENLKDPYHATLLHTFLVTFGLLVAGNRSLMLADATGRHGVMASAKSERKSISSDAKKEMRAYRDGMTLAEPRFMDFIEEFDSPWSVTMATIWPNLIIQREMNTLGVRQIVPTGPHEFIMKWTMFGFEGDDDEMTRHRLRQGNLMGPAGFLGLEDNEAIKFVQDGMRHVPGRQHLVKLDPAVAAGTSDSLISEASIRAMYRHWRAEMGL